MASITYRGEYQWRARIRRSGYPEQTKTFFTKADAEGWVREVEGKMDRGVFVDKSLLEKTTLFDLLNRYEKEITPKKKGVIQEKSKIKILKESYLSGTSIGNIHAVDIVEYRDARLKEVEPATVGREMNLLSHVFNIARSEWGLRGLENPVQGVRRPKLPKGRNRRIESVEELKRIIAATESQTLKVLIPLAIETAMRRSEMVSIKAVDVNLSKCTITLHDSKNGERRTVPLSSRAVALLRTHKPLENGEMFGMRPDSATQAFSRAVKRARKIYEEECKAEGKSPDKNFLTNLRLHDMRHEAASRLFENTDLREFEIMSITGHKDSRQLKRYTHLRATDLAKKLG